MKELIAYNDRKIEITAYSGGIERDLILYKFSRTPENPPLLKDLVFILKEHIKSNIPLSKLHPEEIIYVLYSIRSISVSDSIPLNFDCPICNEKFNFDVSIADVLHKHEYNCSLINNVYSPNIEDYIPFWVENRASVNAYDRLTEYIEKTKTHFNFIKPVKCVNCGESNTLDMANLDLLASVFSSFDIAGFYNSINSLVYYGKCSYKDLLECLLPFERELMTSYIQTEIEKVEKLNKSKNSI